MNETDVRFTASDGWELGGRLSQPSTGGSGAAGVVLVPGSHHERDAWTQTARAITERGLASLRIDIRGRGASLGGTPYARFTPSQRRGVVHDAGAALDAVGTERVGLVAELDTAADAVEGVAGDPRVRAIVLVSPRHGERLVAALADRPMAVFGLVSTEDRAGLRATVDAYLAGAEDGSRLEVFDGLGFGITMASVRAFEHAGAEPLETMIADWLAGRLAPVL